jgi:hypothetical protein
VETLAELPFIGDPGAERAVVVSIKWGRQMPTDPLHSASDPSQQPQRVTWCNGTEAGRSGIRWEDRPTATPRSNLAR